MLLKGTSREQRYPSLTFASPNTVPTPTYPLRGQRGRGGDDRFGERQKLSVGRMTGFANGLLRAGGLAAGAAARFSMAAVRGAGACVRSVAVGDPFAPAMIVHLPYGIDGFGVSRPIYHIAIPIIAVRTKIYRLLIRAIRPTLEGISVTGWNFVRYEERCLIFRADLALTWRRAAAAVGIVMQRIGVLVAAGRTVLVRVLGIAAPDVPVESAGAAPPSPDLQISHT